MTRHWSASRRFRPCWNLRGTPGSALRNYRQLLADGLTETYSFNIGRAG